MKIFSNPIGIYDSGIGGLTVAKAVAEQLPDESIIYFGDTAHLPYGDKSTAAIQAYSIKISDFLLNRSCKVILIACNSASAAAFELIKEYVGSKALVLNVIDPAVEWVNKSFEGKTLGLIGTKQTVFSNVYANKIASLNKGITLKSLATPLLVPMIEEGFFNNNISESIIEKYLSDASLYGIEALILGCTHYPIIKRQIENYYGEGIEVLDSSEVVAKSLKTMLDNHNLRNYNTSPFKQFFVSDYTRSFEESTKLFFGNRITLEEYKLWE